MLIEPTESETLEEIDRFGQNVLNDTFFTAARFCEAMIQIRKEVDDIVAGNQPKDNNLLKNAPHPMSVIASSDWNR